LSLQLKNGLFEKTFLIQRGGASRQHEKTTTGYCKKAMLAGAQDTGIDYCPACGSKDKTIANQAESIVNLARSLSKIVGKVVSAKKCSPIRP